jgi:hypothetical protein
LSRELSGDGTFYAAGRPEEKPKMPNAFAPDEQKRDESRALLSAVADGDAVAVAALLASGTRADAMLSRGGETPLMRAAARGDVEVVRALLDAGADVNAERADGFTPLILAVFFGHEGVVRLLVERGADASARTRLGTTAARWAAARGFAEMAVLLRKAEATRPRVEDSRMPAEASRTPAEIARPHAVAHASRTKAATLPLDDVSIFSRKGERRETRAGVEGDGAFENGDEFERNGAVRRSAVSESAASSSTSASISTAAVKGDSSSTLNEPSARWNEKSSTPAEQTSTRGATASAAGFSAVNVAVRRGVQVPAHPSASGFRVGSFLRSWQGSVGTGLLLLAFVVAVFAFLRGGTTAREVAQPTTLQPALQTVTQLPAPTLPTPQPSPVFPTPDAQSVMPVPDSTYAMPNPSGQQPFYVPPGATSPAPSNAPRDLVVVSSEGGEPASGEDAGRSKRKTEANANNAAPGGAQRESRDEPSAAEDSRTGRSTPPTETEQRSATPVRPSTQSPPPSAPAPSATPARGKVIQWPPQ